MINDHGENDDDLIQRSGNVDREGQNSFDHKLDVTSCNISQSCRLSGVSNQAERLSVVGRQGLFKVSLASTILFRGERQDCWLVAVSSRLALDLF